MEFPNKFEARHTGTGNTYTLEKYGNKWEILNLPYVWSYTKLEIEDYVYRGIWTIKESEVKEYNGVDGDGKPFHFTKEDLKTGMRVTCRNRERFIVLKDVNILAQDSSQQEFGYLFLDSYSENLVFQDKGESKWDVMEIVAFPVNHTDVLNLNARHKETFLWKRVEKSETQIQIEGLEAIIKQAQEQINKLKESI